jgi:hypothetical protein
LRRKVTPCSAAEELNLPGLQYHIAQAEAASAVFLSVMGSVITMRAFIALTHQINELTY